MHPFLSLGRRLPITDLTGSKAKLMHDYFTQLLETIAALPTDAALLCLQRAADEHVLDGRPLLLMATEHAHAGNFDAAEACFIGALQRTPNLTIARFQLGLLQFSSGRPAVASVTWAPLDLLAPDEPLRLFKTGIEYLAQDNFDAARYWLKQGMTKNTANAPLNRDMQHIITEIDKLQMLRAEPDHSSNGKLHTPELAPDEHFLVSANRKLH